MGTVAQTLDCPKCGSAAHASHGRRGEGDARVLRRRLRRPGDRSRRGDGASSVTCGAGGVLDAHAKTTASTAEDPTRITCRESSSTRWSTPWLAGGRLRLRAAGRRARGLAIPHIEAVVHLDVGIDPAAIAWLAWSSSATSQSTSPVLVASAARWNWVVLSVGPFSPYFRNKVFPASVTPPPWLLYFTGVLKTCVHEMVALRSTAIPFSGRRRSKVQSRRRLIGDRARNGRELSPRAIVLDDVNVYWVTDYDYDIRVCALGGCNGSPTTLVQSPTLPVNLFADGTYIYWSSEYMCAVTGCGNAPTVLATSTTGEPGGIVVTGDIVDWNRNHLAKNRRVLGIELS